MWRKQRQQTACHSQWPFSLRHVIHKFTGQTATALECKEVLALRGVDEQSLFDELCDEDLLMDTIGEDEQEAFQDLELHIAPCARF